MTEVGGNAAVYIDSAAAERSAQAVLSHIDNLGELASLGSENVKRFEPGIMADAYMKFYHDLSGRDDE
jgi:hypothetical protein